MVNIIVTLFIGLIAGWLAGELYKGRGFGLIGNIVVGLIGSFIGSLIFSLLGLSVDNFIGNIIVSTVGALVLLFLVNMVRGNPATRVD